MKVATAPIAQFPAALSMKKKALLVTVRFRRREFRLNPPPLRHHYPDEFAVRSVRRQKLAAGDREIDLLRPFVAAKTWRDVPNFVAVRGQGPGVGNEWVPCSYRSELAD
jgi:hypothetical protein